MTPLSAPAHDEIYERIIGSWGSLVSPRAECLRNILAKLRTIPTPDAPLLDEVQSVEQVYEERIYCRVTPEFARYVRAFSAGDDDDRVFSAEGRPLAPVHRQLLTYAVGVRPFPPVYSLTSYRERVTFDSLQIVVLNLVGDEYWADIDIDLGGARTDVAGLFRHWWEIMGPERKHPTDAVELQTSLRRNPVLAPYLG